MASLKGKGVFSLLKVQFWLSSSSDPTNCYAWWIVIILAASFGFTLLSKFALSSSKADLSKVLPANYMSRLSLQGRNQTNINQTNAARARDLLDSLHTSLPYFVKPVLHKSHGVHEAIRQWVPPMLFLFFIFGRLVHTSRINWEQVSRSEYCLGQQQFSLWFFSCVGEAEGMYVEVNAENIVWVLSNSGMLRGTQCAV